MTVESFSAPVRSVGTTAVSRLVAMVAFWLLVPSNTETDGRTPCSMQPSTSVRAAHAASTMRSVELISDSVTRPSVSAAFVIRDSASCRRIMSSPTPGDHLHCDEVILVVLTDSEYRNNVCVVQSGGGFGFSVKPLQHARVKE